tara:strand:- start:1159 stop:1683 length:525 start_codon:yes stop_codon:yes gene_type:complete
MSAIKLNSASGGGSVSFEGPGTSSDDKVIKLPASPGVIVQVVQVTTNNGVSLATSTWTTTGLEASITPSSSSNKVLIQLVSPMTGSPENSSGSLKVYRGGVSGTSVESEAGGLSTQDSENDSYSDAVITYVDSPSTTSATTYTVMMSRKGDSGEYSFNRDGKQTASLILMEVSG